jgi:hypothetical protein
MNARKTSLLLLILLTLLIMAPGCRRQAPQAADPGPAPTQEAYLRNNIHAQERPGRSGNMACWASYANYIDPGPGHFIVPVNTRVIIGEWRRGFTLTDPSDGRIIYFEFNPRNMRMSVDEYLGLITSPSPVSLNELSDIDHKGIRDGKAYRGMTKEGVRMALGYPAVHQTPSLEENAWTYWKNRYKTITVDFFGDGTVRRLR